MNEQEAKAVKLIYQRTVEGVSYSSIIEELNRHGYKTKRGNGFTNNSLHSILKNPKYTGSYTFNRSAAKDESGKRNGHAYKDEEDIIYVENGCPPLVSKEDFAYVQERLQRRRQTQKHSRAKHLYLLRGKMYCGICGGAYVGSRRRANSGGTIWTAYGCNKRHRNSSANCDNREISRPYIEGAVLEALAGYVFDEDSMPQVAKDYNLFLKERCKGEDDWQKNARKRIASLQADVDKLLELVMQSSAPSLLSKLDELEKEKAMLEHKLTESEVSGRVQQVSEDDVRQA